MLHNKDIRKFTGLQHRGIIAKENFYPEQHTQLKLFLVMDNLLYYQ
jgi:hypothetical protein